MSKKFRGWVGIGEAVDTIRSKSRKSRYIGV